MTQRPNGCLKSKPANPLKVAMATENEIPKTNRQDIRSSLVCRCKLQLYLTRKNNVYPKRGWCLIFSKLESYKPVDEKTGVCCCNKACVSCRKPLRAKMVRDPRSRYGDGVRAICKTQIVLSDFWHLSQLFWWSTRQQLSTR
jgi:hypothetical protein